MRKGIKILGKVFSAAVLLLIIVPVALSLLLDIPAVQNYAVHRAACFVSRKLEATVSIDRVDIGIFSKVRVKGFYVEDYQRDTLLYVGKLDAFITSFGIFGGGLELSRGEIADARLYLRQTPGGEMNIKQIVDRISDPDKPKKGNFRLSLKKASIENMDLCLERLDHRDPEHGIDFSHMHLYGITARVDDFTIDGQAIYTSIAAFSARERSGFVLNHLAGRFYMTQGCLGFENASIITPRSNVNFPFVSLAGDSWAQYKDFIGEVRIDASMRNTTVSTDDIAFFAPKLRDWHVDFTDVNVEVAGVVSDFTGRIRSMQIGEGTTLVADASVKGLPDIRKTRFDLSVPRLRSTARAVDELALGIAGRKLSDKLVGVLGNSGQIDLNARFRGLLSSFDMQLGAATGVGNVSCNLKMAPVKGGLSSVRGDVETRNLRLGELLDRRDLLGNATLTAYVDGVIGRGVADANVVGNVTQLGFNGYVYDSLRLDGRLRNREFDGRITARDPNLDFDFFGTVDLNDSVPRYDFITGKRQWHDNPLRLDDRSVLIVEGIHGLNPALTPGVPESRKFKIYVSCFTSVALDNVSRIATSDNRLLRRLTRDYRTRGNDALSTLARWESVRRGEEKHIFPYQENADVMFNSSLFYEISVLRRFAEPILREVPDTVPEYGEAKRMLKFLDNFIPISPEEIPPTSLLREFIGGSSFKY